MLLLMYFIHHLDNSFFICVFHNSSCVTDSSYVCFVTDLHCFLFKYCICFFLCVGMSNQANVYLMDDINLDVYFITFWFVIDHDTLVFFHLERVGLGYHNSHNQFKWNRIISSKLITITVSSQLLLCSTCGYMCYEPIFI